MLRLSRYKRKEIKKSAISLQRCPKLQVLGVAPTNNPFCEKISLNDLSYGIISSSAIAERPCCRVR